MTLFGAVEIRENANRVQCVTVSIVCHNNLSIYGMLINTIDEPDAMR